MPFFTLLVGFAHAQEKEVSPIPAELLIGNNRVFFQMVIQKDLKPEIGLGFFSITNFHAAYDNSTANNEFISQNLLMFSLGKGFAISGGGVLNSNSGFRKIVGTQYGYADEKWLIVSAPSIDLQDSHEIEIMNLVEFRPKINHRWTLYTKIQSLYAFDSVEKHHSRSFFLSRLGLEKSVYRFGLGMNQDWYGAEKLNKPNYGFFCIVSLL